MTGRCLTEDLSSQVDIPLEDLKRREIIRALCNKHETDVTSPDTVGPAAQEMTLGVLRYGDDHRGVVWFDRPNLVLWLCAYARHRSGESEDAFPYFERLRTEERIYPATSDIARLRDDRTIRLVDEIPGDARALVQRATGDPGREFVSTLGSMRVRAVVVELEGLRELHVAISMRTGDAFHLLAILAGLCPDPDDFGDWRPTADLPTGPLDVVGAEVSYSCLLPADPNS